MINKKYILPLLCLSFLALTSCERELSDEAEFSTYPKTAEIFTDTFVGLGANFFFPYSDGFAKAEVLSVDNTEAYEGFSSMRIDVPSPDDPGGNYAGAFFRVDGSARNLTEYNALTFWAKSSRTATLESVGFGQSENSEYQASVSNLTFSTSWRKYVIPIPDASKLVEEAGMLWFVALPNEESGYTFWMDEIKFENLGSLGFPEPKIMNGEEVETTTFNGVTTNLTGLVTDFDIGNGEVMTVNTSPAYYDFSSSVPSVALVDANGGVSINTSGSTVITAEMNAVAADGFLSINSLGNLSNAPTPTRDANNVISIFSDAYNSVPVDYYNGFFEPWQTTLGGAVDISGETIISYTDLNFVAIGTFLNVSTVNLTDMTHLHVDLNVQEQIDSGDFIRLEINSFIGGNEVGASYTINAADLTSQQWSGFDIPLSSFSGSNAGLANRENVGLYFFVSDFSISELFVDNYYFYKE